MLRVIAASVLLAVSSQIAGAQQLPPPSVLHNPVAGGGNLTSFLTTKTPYEFWLSCLIGLLGLAIIYALVFSLRRLENARPEDITRPVIVITVIIGTLILVTVGYSNEQIAPAFGLFGTIIGYMLGRLSSSQTATAGTSPKPDGAEEKKPGE